MKAFITTDMKPDKKMHLFGNLLGSFGNENIRAYHVKYFESKVLEYKENEESDISLTPNYYAWLSIITEHTFCLIRNFCFRQTEFAEQNLELLYNELVTRFCDVTRTVSSVTEQELVHLYNILVKVLEIRHALIHKGFPNLIPVLLQKSKKRNKPAATDGGYQEKFDELTTLDIVTWYSNPKNFEKIRHEFRFITETISKGPDISVSL